MAGSRRRPRRRGTSVSGAVAVGSSRVGGRTALLGRAMKGQGSVVVGAPRCRARYATPLAPTVLLDVRYADVIQDGAQFLSQDDNKGARCPETNGPSPFYRPRWTRPGPRHKPCGQPRRTTTYSSTLPSAYPMPKKSRITAVTTTATMPTIVRMLGPSSPTSVSLPHSADARLAPGSLASSATR